MALLSTRRAASSSARCPIERSSGWRRTARRTILADRFEGKRFSGPNDVVVKSNGSVYFTDSISGLRGAAASPQRELPFSGFYLVKDGKVTLLDEKLRDPEVAKTAFPNGIALSPDEKHLYVTNGRKIMRYEIGPTTPSQTRSSSPTFRAMTA